MNDEAPEHVEETPQAPPPPPEPEHIEVVCPGCGTKYTFDLENVEAFKYTCRHCKTESQVNVR